MTLEAQNLIHGQNGNNPVLCPHVYSCHADDWMSGIKYWTQTCVGYVID